MYSFYIFKFNPIFKYRNWIILRNEDKCKDIKIRFNIPDNHIRIYQNNKFLKEVVMKITETNFHFTIKYTKYIQLLHLVTI